MTLRKWQSACWEAYQRNESPIFMLEACPGSGKTKMSLHIFAELFARKVVEFVVVVAPTDYIRSQWARSAKEAQLEIMPIVARRDFSRLHGIVITYAQMLLLSEFLQNWCLSKKVMVVFDEIHHAGEEKSWGDTMMKAFRYAARILGISGTPFRHDDAEIPFVVYRNGVSQSDFSYGYGEALQDRVCRNVLFRAVTGKGSWIDRFKNERKADFSEELSDSDASRLLRTALEPDTDFISDFMLQSYRYLNEIRANDQCDAALLLIAMNQAHAYILANKFEALTGVAPVIAVSDDKDAASKIRSFKNSNEPAIFTVKMVSEGVDIPRLRVLAYATNVRTEMFFRQAVGRIVRVQGGREDDVAHFLFPADAQLCEYAERIEKERKHVLNKRPALVNANASGGQAERCNGFEPLSATSNGSILINRDERNVALRVDLMMKRLADLMGVEVEEIEMTWEAQSNDGDLFDYVSKEHWLQEKIGRYSMISTMRYIPK